MSSQRQLITRNAKTVAREAIVSIFCLIFYIPSFYFVCLYLLQRKTSRKKNVPLTPIRTIEVNNNHNNTDRERGVGPQRPMAPSSKSTPFVFAPPTISTPITSKAIPKKFSSTLKSSAIDESTNQSIVLSSAEDNESHVSIDDESFNHAFSMLHTDDSTDEESNYEIRGRPPPPTWSLQQNRENSIRKQSKISLKLIDRLFSTIPVCDLKEIFPDVGKKLLARRESSFGWNTMVNHSRMPRY